MKARITYSLALLAALAAFSTPAAAQSALSNDHLSLSVNGAYGDVALRTTGGADGDALAGDDNDKTLVYGLGSTSESAVTVDGQRSYLRDVAPESVSSQNGNVTMTWRTGDLTVTRKWSLARSTSGNSDMMRVSTTLQNSGAVSHGVSLFFGIDTMIGANDGAPLYTNAGIIETETLLSGAQVPSSWQAFEQYDVANPGLTAMGVLDGGDATKPDRFLLGNWPNGVGQSADYVGNGSAIADYNDTAVSLWWDNRTIVPGGALEIVTYYGVGSGTTVSGNLALNLTSPAVLTIDAATNQLTPNPFDVNLVVENNHPYTASNVLASLSLPPGLTLVSGDALASAGDIPAGGTALVTWQVEATAPAAGSGNGTADASDLSEGSPAALATLAFVNDAATDFTRLDVDAAITSTAASNIIAHRNGGDGAFGTGDDDLFDTIAELDAISYVGPSTLHSLATYAIGNGYAGGSGEAVYTYFVDVTADNDSDVYSADRDVRVPPIDDGVLDGLDVIIHSTDPSDFETVEMIVSVNDSDSGDFVSSLDSSHFHVTEDGVAMESCTVELLSQSTSASKADIVFVFDVSGSMDDEIADLKSNIIAFADELAISNVDYNLGLVTYSDFVTGTYGMTQDVSEFRALIQSIFTDSGSVENPFDAIVEAMTLDLRESSDRIFILATDETYNVVSNTGAQALQALNANSVRLHAATLPELNADYDALVAGSGGSFFDLTGSFAAVLDDLRDEIINRYKVRCDSPRPVRDNTWRNVNVEVDAGDGRGGEDADQYFIEGGALRITPAYSVADVGADFTVDVVADSVSALHNAHIVLDFDPSYLAFVGAEPGELLARDSSTGAVSTPIIIEGIGHDPANGRLELDVARQSPEGTNGTGVLLQLTFTLTNAAADDVDDTETDDLVFVTGAGGVYLEDNSLSEIRVTAVSNGDVDSTGTSLLGDFDEDGDIDLIDFNTLVANWGSTTATLTGTTGGDIGPATGTAPNLVAAPDAVVDFRDLFVFTRMFNWYRFER